MRKVYIFGLGWGKTVVDRCLLKGNIELAGYIDNYKAGSVNEDGLPVIGKSDLTEGYSYIVVSLTKYDNIRQELMSLGVAAEKIICFFNVADAGNEAYWNVLDSYKWRTELLWRHYTGTVMPTLDNLNYEIYGESETIKSQCPRVTNADKAVEILLKEKKSLARFGDGEFELMCGRHRAEFQDADNVLGGRLREALQADENNLMVAIADNYGRLDKYTDRAAADIRAYMSRSVREEHMQLLEFDREYYDAYLSRPYMIYRDKKKAGVRFGKIRKIWDGQDVLVVEGEHTRFGVGNDLLDNAAGISRILAPDKNAFSKYDEILEEVRRRGDGKLILATLGPTATVLAYDLAKEGYRIIDIGQLDVEYEWFLRGVEERCDIPYKCVSEVNQYVEIATDASVPYIQKYMGEIVCRIG